MAVTINVPGGELRVLADLHEVHRAAAEEVVRVAEDVLRRRKVATIALSGGRTPQGLYELLAGSGDPTFRRRLPWQALHFFWSDERFVPADHPQSNYRMVREAMLSKVQATRKQVHRMVTEGRTPEQAAREHEREMRAFFGEQLMMRGDVPRMDLMLLGLGADGHVASLFPRSPAMVERKALVTAATAPDGVSRLTLTPPVLQMAARVIMLVAGPEKAAAVAAGVAEKSDPLVYPSHAARPSDGSILWLVDREAGRSFT